MKDTEITVAGKVVGEYDMCPDDDRPDWDQDDNEAPNFVKNRPAYRKRLDSLCTPTPVDVIQAKNGDIFRMDDDSWPVIGRRVLIGYINSFLLKRDYAPIYMGRIRQEFFSTNVKANYARYWDLHGTYAISDIGTGGNHVMKSNTRCIVSDNVKLFAIYFIGDPQYLYDSYKTMFTTTGIYLEFYNLPQGAAKYCKTTFEAYYYHQFDASYIPRQAFLVPEPAASDKNKVLATDANGKIEWQTGAADIPSATAADVGKVLMIGSDGKPAWTTLPTSTSENT